MTLALIANTCSFTSSSPISFIKVSIASFSASSSVFRRSHSSPAGDLFCSKGLYWGSEVRGVCDPGVLRSSTSSPPPETVCNSGDDDSLLAATGSKDEAGSSEPGNSPLPGRTSVESGFCTVSDGRPSLGRSPGEARTEDEAEGESEGEGEGEREDVSGNSSLPRKNGDIPGVWSDIDGGPSLARGCGEAGTEAEAENKGGGKSENRPGSPRNSLPQKSGDRPMAVKSALMSAYPKSCDVGERGSLPEKRKSPTDTSGGADWNGRRKLDKERVEQWEEGRERGREEGPGGNGIADSSNPLLWQTSDGSGAGAGAGAAKSTGKGRAEVCHPSTSESSLVTTI